jgi:plastocyanin
VTIRRAVSMLATGAISLFATTAIVAAPAGAGGGVPPCEKPITQAAGTEVQIDLSCFMPTVLEVSVGRTVRFVNQSAMPHTVTGVGGSFGNTTMLNQGATLDATFDKVGVFPYYCILHPGMSGSVAVSADTVRTPAALAPTTRSQSERQAAPAAPLATARSEPEGQALSAATSPPLAGGSDATIVVLLLAQLGLTILIGFSMLWNRLDRA